MSRPFIQEDLIVLQGMRNAELIEIIEQQRSCWPKGLPFNKKLPKNQYCAELINPANGFRTDFPLPSSSIPPPPPPVIVASATPGSVTINPHSTPTPTSPVDANMFAPEFDLSMIIDAPSHLDELNIDLSQPMDLHVFMIDYRVLPAAKTALRMKIDVADTIDCEAGEWRAKFIHIYQQIQSSSAIIVGKGIIRIGVPNKSHSEYTDFHMRGEINFLSFSDPKPEYVIINGNELCVRIDFDIPNRIHLASHDFTPKSKKTSKRSMSTPSPYPLTPLSSPSLSASGSRSHPMVIDDDDDDNFMSPGVATSSAAKNRDIAELRGLIAQEPGYDIFVSSRGKVLQNPAVVVQWRFAQRMMTKYHRWILSSGRSTMRYMVHKALGYQGSWGKQTIDAANLVDIYGEGGSHPSPEVIQELGQIQDNPHGALPLFDYLRAYALAHPVPDA